MKTDRKLTTMVALSVLSFLAFDVEPGWSQALNERMGTPAAAPKGVAASDVVNFVAPQSITTLVGQVDHVANGVGLRNLGSGTIRLRGAPSSASDVAVAILYFGFICSATCPTSQTVFFQGTAVTALLIGTAPPPCWPGTAYGAYKVEVTGLISAGINDDYSIAGVPSGATDAGDPWNSSVIPPLAEGASLVVVYVDPTLPTGAVYINDGAVTGGTVAGEVVNIDNPTSPPLPGTFRRFTRLGADGQVGFSVTANPSTSGEKTFIGPTPGPLVQIAGPGSTRNTDSDWNGHDGVPLNQLWDTHTEAFSGIIPAGTTSYRVQYQFPDDCVSWTAHVLTAR